MALCACLDGLFGDHERLLLSDQLERGHGRHGRGRGGRGDKFHRRFIYLYLKVMMMMMIMTMIMMMIAIRMVIIAKNVTDHSSIYTYILHSSRLDHKMSIAHVGFEDSHWS